MEEYWGRWRKMSNDEVKGRKRGRGWEEDGGRWRKMTEMDED